MKNYLTCEKKASNYVRIGLLNFTALRISNLSPFVEKEGILNAKLELFWIVKLELKNGKR